MAWDGPEGDESWAVPGDAAIEATEGQNRGCRISADTGRAARGESTASVWPISSPCALVASYGAYVVCEGADKAHTQIDESSDAE